MCQRKQQRQLQLNARNQESDRPLKHTQSQYVLRTWLAVCQLRVPQVSLLVSGPPPQINLQEDVTRPFDPSRVQQACHCDQSLSYVVRNSITGPKAYKLSLINPSTNPTIRFSHITGIHINTPCRSPAPQLRKKYAHGASTTSSRGRTDRKSIRAAMRSIK